MATFDLEIVHQQKDAKPSTVWTSVSYRTEMLLSPMFHDGGLYSRPHAPACALGRTLYVARSARSSSTWPHDFFVTDGVTFLSRTHPV